ncbi:hypothetical protein GAO09_27215 [Rhizobiales bacterium RZME27]|uniref:Uncharacterized protein n=1 Tax=Endobacterium cereale TaxID=2663029 RepID=A0A6A8ALW9_9HYPH|nr:hypothetical protein [Endobacterium cereale]MEB2843025.1 hypothetical protein [Endobacterium cereale]MQY49721.1 hypothetical protein [Endobacterium cereale]
MLELIAGMLFSVLPVESVLTIQPVERPATRAEIERAAVGRTLIGVMTYSTDGRYSYGTASTGNYTIADGQVCVTFDRGGYRCDRIVTLDGTDLALINARGERFVYK